jgi:hypothetical protein
MKKNCIVLVVLLILCCLLTSCGEKDKLRMSIEEVGKGVIYNKSMVGVSDTLNKFFKPEIVFDNNDPNKMRFITNNYRTQNKVDITLDIEKGVYYEAFQPVGDKEYARSVCIFLEFKSSAEAEKAMPIIQSNVFTGKNEDGSMNLEYCTVSIRQNVIAVIVGYEENTMKELTRVFNSTNYVK